MGDCLREGGPVGARPGPDPACGERWGRGAGLRQGGRSCDHGPWRQAGLRAGWLPATEGPERRGTARAKAGG